MHRDKNEPRGEKAEKRRAGGNSSLFLGVAESALKSVCAKWCKNSNYSYRTKGSKQALEASSGLWDGGMWSKVTA